jgi:hypothetical protein
MVWDGGEVGGGRVLSARFAEPPATGVVGVCVCGCVDVLVCVRVCVCVSMYGCVSVCYVFVCVIVYIWWGYINMEGYIVICVYNLRVILIYVYTIGG